MALYKQRVFCVADLRLIDEAGAVAGRATAGAELAAAIGAVVSCAMSLLPIVKRTTVVAIFVAGGVTATSISSHKHTWAESLVSGKAVR